MQGYRGFGRLAAITIIAVVASTSGARAGGRLKAHPTPGGTKISWSVSHARRGSLSRVGYFSKSGGKGRHFAHGGGISCVPFARDETGIELSGNAAAWWDHAEGVYARGQQPEPASILTFRASGGMRLGHVAVVEQVVGSREILIDHANWPGGNRGGISRSISVVDTSASNDWTSVRVQMGAGEYGRDYPTYGFIYDRPDRPELQNVSTTIGKFPVGQN